METSRSATASADMGESSSLTNREVSICVESFLNEIMESIKEMNKGDDQPFYVSDLCVDIANHEIKRFLWPVLQDGIGSIKEENWPNMKIKISKRKVIKAWLKEQFQGNGNGLIRKFFRALRKLRKRYKLMAKKLKDYAKERTKSIDWKLATRLIFLIAVIAVLTCAVIAFFFSPLTASLALAFAAVVLAFFTILQDWYETLFKENENKSQWEEDSISSALIMNEDFGVGAEAEFQNIKKAMETGSPEVLCQLANSFKRMLVGGKKVIEKIKEVKNKAN
ncbi:hypothetical protein MRB53_021617 [Persea americana]|uniref:Uncharacterized protein n=1 Tax=Persea americana TaxID=3435 RepID=A0ACC2L4W4_PERAE|nr:hypothetical protein MRB53_021617 [Persea americana]